MQNNLLMLIILLAIVGGIAACLPLFRYSRRLAWMVVPTVLLVLLGYSIWGGYFAFSDYQSKLAKAEEINALLASPEKTRQLIKRITSQLDDSPQSAQGWRLVGKLYLLLHEEQKAKAAFEKAAQ